MKAFVCLLIMCFTYFTSEAQKTENDTIFDALFEQAYEHTLNDYRTTPEQRYLQLLVRYPRLFEIVSLGEKATYLNILRRQLHRIRKVIVAETVKQ